MSTTRRDPPPVGCDAVGRAKTGDAGDSSRPDLPSFEFNDDWHWELELRHTPDWRELIIAELDRRPIDLLQLIDRGHEETHYWEDAPVNLRALDIWIGDATDLNQAKGQK